ncbi:MAG: VWA domain-containing protein [Candidatus Tectimicrobiota bacterium]
MRVRRRFPAWLVLFVLFCWLGPSGRTALAADPMRAVLLLDNSGSMRQNDPQRLSHVAVQLFLALARPQDHVGVVAFSDTGTSLCPLMPMRSAADKQACLARLQALHFTGQTTDLRAALQAGLASFPTAVVAGSRDLVVLLTDGKQDLGPQQRAAEAAALAALRDTVLPQYLERRIAVYTLAFTAAADRDLLREMARTTSGEFRFIPNATVLHTAFSDLFVAAKAAESVPIQQGAVVLDRSIQEASLVLGKKHAREPLSLVTPGKQRLQARSTHPGVQWQSTPTYDMIQLTAPEPGTWRVERASGGEHDVAIIGASTLSLSVSLGADYLEAGEALTIQARLLENAQPLQDAQRLQEFTVQAELQTPAGERQTIMLQPGPEAGMFSASQTIPEPTGQYSLLVRALSDTVQRQRTISFIPQPRCFLPRVLPEPAFTVQVALTDVCPAFGTLALAAGYVRPPEREPAAWHALAALQPRLWQATLPAPSPAADSALLLRLQGTQGRQQAFTLYKGPLALPGLAPALPAPQMVRPEPPFNWWALGKTLAWQLLVVNLVLGLGSAGGWRFYLYTRTRRARHG